MMADENQNSVPSEPTPVQEPAAETAEVEDFSTLLAEHEQSLQKKEFKRGMIVEGVIVQIGAEFAYVNIGAKAEASIPIAEITNPEDNKLMQNIGDTIKAKIIGFDQSGIKLSRSLRAGNIALEEAYRDGTAVKALVKATNKGGYELEIMGQRAFCPLSQFQREKLEDPNSVIGQSFEFKIIKYAKRGRDFVLSRTALLDEKKRLSHDEILSKLSVGMDIDGKIVSVQKYGAFVDLGGIEGLLHVSELSYHRVNDAQASLKPNQEIRVRIIGMDKNEKGKMKISLSTKCFEDDPFDAMADKLRVGQHITGTVVRIIDNLGAFVDLDGIEGLIHITEMNRHSNASDALKIGTPVDVVILYIDAEKHRIRLGLQSTDSSSWSAEPYKVGDQITGTVETITNFGIFVKLTPLLTALLPMSEIGESAKSVLDLKSGDEVSAKIIAIDPDKKRITLSVLAENESPRKRINADPHDNPHRESNGHKGKSMFGTFGDAFKSIIKK